MDRIIHRRAVAVKTLISEERQSTVSVKNLLMEIRTRIQVGDHPNIVKFIGACTSNIHQSNLLNC
jgi:hypothetical protein